ncbi:hypothetical protein [Pseudovibrio sp. WM33]|uniref:hypothetical protein n=1 Tax=Pseudovibrio sp. WM33 TaxID=1735585 RepID=UPI0007AEBC3D|nr:hypothetical protein [Pseudovibrio sp. WM33]KZL17843.1 DNA polymerase III subunit beta [Pseudovibrio sp. WM33]
MKRKANSQNLFPSIPVPLYKLKAAQKVLKTVEKFRAYLTCLRVEFKDDSALLIATNGYILLAQSVKLKENVGSGSFVIPRQIIEILPKLTKHNRNEPYLLTPTAVKGHPLSFGWENADFNFPNWRDVIPSDDYEKSLAKYDPKYVQLLNDIGTVLHARSCEIHPNGEPKPALVTFEQVAEAFGVIMPMKLGKLPTKKPFEIWEQETEEEFA